MTPGMLDCEAMAPHVEQNQALESGHSGRYQILAKDVHRLQEACRYAMTRGNARRGVLSDTTIPRARVALSGHNCAAAMRYLCLAPLGVNADALSGQKGYLS